MAVCTPISTPSPPKRCGPIFVSIQSKLGRNLPSCGQSGKWCFREVMTLESGDFGKWGLMDMCWGGWRSAQHCVMTWQSGDLEKWRTRHCSGCFYAFRRFLHVAATLCFGIFGCKTKSRGRNCCMGLVLGWMPRRDTLRFLCKVPSGGDEGCLVCANGAGCSFSRVIGSYRVFVHRAVVRFCAVLYKVYWKWQISVHWWHDCQMPFA